jgi:Phage gp6-like head-tail connector protein
MHKSLEVVTPSACMDLTTLETVKDELGIAQTDTSQDDRLAVLIKQASGVVAEYCNRIFGAEEVTETFWADWPSEQARSFMLSREPVSEIVSVEIDGVVQDPSTYRMANDGHLHRLGITGLSFWCLTSTVIITYIAGYVLLDDLPYGVERAALSLIKGYHFATGSDPSIRSESIPGVRDVSYQVGSLGDASTLPPEVIALLSPHRRLAFA